MPAGRLRDQLRVRMLVHVRRGRMRVRCENVSLPLSLKKLRVREARDPEAYVNFSASGRAVRRPLSGPDPDAGLQDAGEGHHRRGATSYQARRSRRVSRAVPVRTPLPGRATPPTDAEV